MKLFKIFLTFSMISGFVIDTNAGSIANAVSKASSQISQNNTTLPGFPNMVFPKPSTPNKNIPDIDYSILARKLFEFQKYGRDLNTYTDYLKYGGEWALKNIVLDPIKSAIVTGASSWIISKIIQGYYKAADAARALKHSIVEDFGFANIVGEVSPEVKDLVEIYKMDMNSSIPVKLPKGILFVGPPGTGKTLLARAIAGELKIPVFAVSMGSLVTGGAEAIRSLFNQARAVIATGKAKKVLIFIDELDAIGTRFGKKALGAYELSVLNQLLTELEGFEDRNDIIVIAATNRPENVDPALKRAGRFDWTIEISLPDKKKREALIRNILAKKGVDSLGLNLEKTLELSEEFNVPDILVLVEKAAMLAVNDNRNYITEEDLDSAASKVKISKDLTKKVFDI